MALREDHSGFILFLSERYKRSKGGRLSAEFTLRALLCELNYE
jgi:hypothetical protein